MKQPVLVLGATGFIGRHVLTALTSTDWADPIAGVRQGVAAGEPGQRVVDVTNSQSLATSLNGLYAVVNCTAPAPPLIASTVKTLVDAAASAAPSLKIIHLSSMAVYGSASSLVDEDAPLRGDLGDYSAAKVAAESIALTRPGTVILRPGCVYGPGSTQWSHRFGRYLVARRLGDLGANGDGFCNLVHVEDVAQAVIRSIRAPIAGGRAYNLSYPNPPTWNEYLIRFARALGAVPVRRISNRRLRVETKLLAPPLKIAEIAAKAARLSAAWLPPAIPPSLAGLMRQTIQLDTRRAENELGINWRNWEAGLQETARWFLAQGSRA